MRSLLLLVSVLLGFPSFAAEPALDARDLILRAVEAHGGEVWLSPRTLILAGEAEFFAADQAEPISRVDDYRMWREMNPNRDSAHGADGKVRIDARTAGKLVFSVGYDGQSTWTDKGVMPAAEAEAYWASNFGFGIIRAALDKKLRMERAPNREVGGHPVDMVRIYDARGETTLFGFDKESHFIRYMAFQSPRGWHERKYDDFMRLTGNNWVQAREVTLFYNGVMANRVRWRSAEIGTPIEPSQFEFVPAKSMRRSSINLKLRASFPRASHDRIRQRVRLSTIGGTPR